MVMKLRNDFIITFEPSTDRSLDSWKTKLGMSDLSSHVALKGEFGRSSYINAVLGHLNVDLAWSPTWKGP